MITNLSACHNNNYSINDCIFIDPTEAEMEEREGLAFWNLGIPKSGGIQGEGVHWRRDYIIRQGATNSDSL